MQSSYRRRNEENSDQIDEIQRFHDCRYISACEAVWRIFGFEIHYRTPPVERLRFHLPDEQSVVFNDEDPIDSVIDNPTIGMTKFLAWMDCNKSSEEAQQLLYSQFPTKFVWKQEERAWHPRKSGFALGRMHNVSPNCGELYYMRTLLNFVKGPKSYEDLRWFDDVLHPTFRGACYARGLLGDDKEYIDVIEEASRWGSGSYLRNLFVTLLLSAAIAMPSKVWEKTWKHLSDDILYQQRNALQNQALRLTEDELKNYALLDIEACLQRAIAYVVENSTCSRIKPGSDLAELLIRTKLIIWDEAPMTHKYAFEAVDGSLRDVMRFSNDGDINQPFGGKVVVFGGDFRQILPVIPKGSRSEIVNASLCASNLWPACKSVGDPIASIVDAIYPSLENQLSNPEYLQERAILAPTHEIVDLVNDYVLSRIDATEKIYFSSDEVSKDESNIGVRDLYTTEFLNSIKCSGLPNHELRLKVGAIVMLLRNIDQSHGLCNGTRLIVTDLGSRVI
ncbi:uncharacterized protein LOC141651111 [Silene latifolia]|uniref:uncharacterized protein LOC141651111 n=1 Tax=Silene latifolia TaxID=37657 RepID=UPI003D7776F1